MYKANNTTQVKTRKPNGGNNTLAMIKRSSSIVIVEFINIA